MLFSMLPNPLDGYVGVAGRYLRFEGELTVSGGMATTGIDCMTMRKILDES